MRDLISRQAAIDALDEVSKHYTEKGREWHPHVDLMIYAIKELPSAQPEPLTDKEQRIFLAAMAREEKVCEEVDRNYVHEPYEDSLVSVCKAIRRKVKDTLWT